MLRYPGIERFYCLAVIFIGLFQTADDAHSLVTAATCGSDVRTTATKGSDVAMTATNGSDVTTAATNGSDEETTATNGSDVTTTATKGSDVTTAATNGIDMAPAATNQWRGNGRFNAVSVLNNICGVKTFICYDSDLVLLNAINGRDVASAATCSTATIATPSPQQVSVSHSC